MRNTDRRDPGILRSGRYVLKPCGVSRPAPRQKSLESGNYDLERFSSIAKVGGVRLWSVYSVTVEVDFQSSQTAATSPETTYRPLPQRGLLGPTANGESVLSNGVELRRD